MPRQKIVLWGPPSPPFKQTKGGGGSQRFCPGLEEMGKSRVQNLLRTRDFPICTPPPPSPCMINDQSLIMACPSGALFTQVCQSRARSSRPDQITCNLGSSSLPTPGKGLVTNYGEGGGVQNGRRGGGGM